MLSLARQKFVLQMIYLAYFIAFLLSAAYWFVVFDCRNGAKRQSLYWLYSFLFYAALIFVVITL